MNLVGCLYPIHQLPGNQLTAALVKDVMMVWSFGSTALSWSSDPTTIAMVAAACRILVMPECVVERNAFCDRQEMRCIDRQTDR